MCATTVVVLVCSCVNIIEIVKEHAFVFPPPAVLVCTTLRQCSFGICVSGLMLIKDSLLLSRDHDDFPVLYREC